MRPAVGVCRVSTVASVRVLEEEKTKTGGVDRPQDSVLGPVPVGSLSLSLSLFLSFYLSLSLFLSPSLSMYVSDNPVIECRYCVAIMSLLCRIMSVSISFMSSVNCVMSHVSIN